MSTLGLGKSMNLKNSLKKNMVKKLLKNVDEDSDEFEGYSNTRSALHKDLKVMSKKRAARQRSTKK